MAFEFKVGDVVRVTGGGNEHLILDRKAEPKVTLD